MSPSQPKPLAKRQNASRKRRRNLSIPDNLIAEVLAYLDASDYVSLLWASENIFVTPLRFHLSSTKSLCLSFLLKKFPNTFSKDSRQQLAVQLLMVSLLGRSPRNKLKYLELSNLRGVTGRDWLEPGLSKIPLVTLDLTNCRNVERSLIDDYLSTCPKTLRNLHLNGIPAVGASTLDCIGTHHPDVVSLSLGACAQTISATDVFKLLKKVTSLKHLDLQALTHLQDKISPESDESFMDVLPESLESLNLSGTKPLRLVSQDVFATMNTYLDRSLEYIQRFQGDLQNIQADLNAFNNEGLNADVLLHRFLGGNDRQEAFIWKNEPTFRLKIKHLVLNGTGPGRSGISRASVATLSLGRCLREVHLGGCEAITDWEIMAIAMNCGETLTCFQMRGGSIGNPAIEALGKHCRVLAELDVSACFGIDDTGILGFVNNMKKQKSSYAATAPNDNDGEELQRATKRSRISKWTSPLTILRIAALPKLTDSAIASIAHMKSLIVLDIHDCKGIGASAVFRTIKQLPCLVDVDAKGIYFETNFSLPAWLRIDPDTPRTLKRVNNRVFKRSKPVPIPKHCCIVRCQAQKLSPTTPLAPMYHCVDCDLLPDIDRGFCVECLQQCHVGHKTFLGSFARFSCDCPFGTANATNICRAIKSSNDSNPIVVNEQIHTK